MFIQSLSMYSFNFHCVCKVDITPSFRIWHTYQWRHLGTMLWQYGRHLRCLRPPARAPRICVRTQPPDKRLYPEADLRPLLKSKQNNGQFFGPGKHVQSNIISMFLWETFRNNYDVICIFHNFCLGWIVSLIWHRYLQLCNVYSQVLVHTAEWTGAM